jgi:hypothetical protein
VTQLCKKTSAKKSQQGHARYGEELLRRSKCSCKNEVVVSMKMMIHIHNCDILLIALYNLQMGYGSRALSLLKKYYEFKIPSIEEDQLPQEHIKSVEDEKVGLLKERIGKFFILTCSVWPIDSHRNCL